MQVQFTFRSQPLSTICSSPNGVHCAQILQKTPPLRPHFGRFPPPLKLIFPATGRQTACGQLIDRWDLQKKQLSTLRIFRSFDSKCTARCRGKLFLPHSLVVRKQTTNNIGGTDEV